jgi:nitrite reductase (NO-forming)
LVLFKEEIMKSKLFAILAAVVLFGLGGCTPRAPTETQKATNPLAVLKKDMKAEEGVFTFAPNVPPPLTRTEPRIVNVHWNFIEKECTIAPDVVYKECWTIEGSVPGPMLRLHVGDILRLSLTNKLAKMPHNLDFHFVTGPGGGAEKLLVAPGETRVIEVRARSAGLFMYHCAVPGMVPIHVANGMYGSVLVEDPLHPLPKVAREFYLTQSEWYVGEKEEDGKYNFSMDRMTLEHPSYVVWNGSVGSLTGDKALTAKVGETARFYVINEGPNLTSSFHIIGTIFKDVYREGDIYSPPAHAIQTTAIPSGGSTITDIEFTVPGTFIIVDHAIGRVYKGLVGQINVSGNPNPEIFEAVKSGAGEMSETHQH